MEQALATDASCGRRVALLDTIGEWSSLSLAEHLAQTGRHVTVFVPVAGFAWRTTIYSTLATRRRLRELGVRHVVSGSKEKGGAFDALVAELGIRAEETAMIGDDLPDLPILRRCGMPIAVRDASQEVLDVARFVTPRPGGSGAVRDAVEHILKAQGRWIEAVRLFDPEHPEPTPSRAGGGR